MTDYEAGQLVTVVQQLNIQVKEMNDTTKALSCRINDLEKQLCRGKGMLAGAMVLSLGLGGLGGQVFGKWFN
tara:strand:- start:339 stop:554 length:216 start_codon:yes stop_codon:yes gene_type:complete